MINGGVNYGLSIIHAGNRARVQANAPCLFRCCNSISARSWSGMTFLPIANACACRRNTAFRNRRRCFSPHVSRYAPTSISMASSSTVTRGISSGFDGGSSSTCASPNATRTPRCNHIGTRNGYTRKTCGGQFVLNADQRPACPPAECAAGPLAVPPSGQRAIPPHGRTAGLKPAASLCPSILGRTASQAGGNLFRLPEGLGAATPGRLRKRIKSPIKHPALAKVGGDDLGHSSVVLKSPGRPEVQPTCT